MSIIFEGVDGIGKTTAAKEWIYLNPEYHYIHNFEKTRKETDIKSEITKELLLFNSNESIVFDRSYIISEYVYSTILQRETPLKYDHLKSIIYSLNMHGHTVKLFYTTDITNLHYKQEDKQLPFEALNNFYLELIQGLGLYKLILEDIGDRK